MTSRLTFPTAFIDRQLMFIVFPVNVFTFGVKMIYPHVFIHILPHESNAFNQMRNVHVEGLEEISKKLIDSHTVVEDQIGRFTELFNELRVNFSL